MRGLNLSVQFLRELIILFTSQTFEGSRSMEKQDLDTSKGKPIRKEPEKVMTESILFSKQDPQNRFP